MTKAPDYAPVLELMGEVWEYCKSDKFASAHPRLCAAAMVAALGERGWVVRRNYWIKVKHRPPPSVIKAASKIVGNREYIPLRELIARAVRVFMTELERLGIKIL